MARKPNGSDSGNSLGNEQPTTSSNESIGYDVDNDGANNGFERPPGTASDGGTAKTDGQPRRGRPPGSGSGTKNGAKKESLDLDKFARQIFGAHQIAVAVTRNELFAISEDEARALASAIHGLASQYNLSVSPKAQAWGALLFTSASIYGPRIILTMQMRAMQKAQSKSTRAPLVDPEEMPVDQSGFGVPPGPSDSMLFNFQEAPRA